MPNSRKEREEARLKAHHARVNVLHKMMGAEAASLMDLPQAIVAVDPYTRSISLIGPFPTGAAAFTYIEAYVAALIDDVYTVPVQCTVYPLVAPS